MNLKEKSQTLSLNIYCVCVGYEGENCQVDIDECEQHPCENGGECFQRSDPFNYRILSQLNITNFTFEEAAGFLCHCLPGFTGKPVNSRDPLASRCVASLTHHELMMTEIGI